MLPITALYAGYDSFHLPNRQITLAQTFLIQVGI